MSAPPPAPPLLTFSFHHPNAPRRQVALAPIVCVLEDYQAARDPAILDLLQALSAHPLAGLHLRVGDPRLDEAETAACLRGGLGRTLSAPDLARLAARTEAWPAGCHPAGLSLPGRADPTTFVETLSGSHCFILS